MRNITPVTELSVSPIQNGDAIELPVADVLAVKQFEVTLVVLSGHPMLRVTGELDIATAPELAAAVESELSSAPPPASLGFDLTDTTFLDSSGARSIATAFRAAHAAGTEMYVLCPPANTRVRRTLSLLQFGDVMPIVDGVAPGIEPPA